MGYMDEVFKGLAVLCGSRPRCLESEASLRRFQFKMWLRTDQWPADCFEQAGRMFAAAKITMAMRVDPAQLLAGSGYKESPAASFISAIKRERSLFNTTFRNRELLTVPSRADYESVVARSLDDRAEIRDLNIQTRCRLRLTNSKAKSTMTNS